MYLYQKNFNWHAPAMVMVWFYFCHHIKVNSRRIMCSLCPNSISLYSQYTNINEMSSQISARWRMLPPVVARWRHSSSILPTDTPTDTVDFGSRELIPLDRYLPLGPFNVTLRKWWCTFNVLLCRVTPVAARTTLTLSLLRACVIIALAHHLCKPRACQSWCKQTAAPVT